MSNYYSENLENHTRVKFPAYNPRKVLAFLREHFGDNNIHESVEQRRWVTVGYSEYIYFRDERDAVWFKLRWSNRVRK